MRHCLTTIIIFSFLFTGCIPNFVLTPAEISAKDHMQQAQDHEQAFEYEKAAKEYGIISQKYPDTSYYEEALFKSALMNIDPKNPKPDYSVALDQLTKYSKFSLSYNRRLVVKGYLALITQIQKNQDQEKGCTRSIKKQKKDIAVLNKSLKNYKIKIKELEDKLQKMKDIDVQMHENRRKQRSTSE